MIVCAGERPCISGVEEYHRSKTLEPKASRFLLFQSTR